MLPCTPVPNLVSPALRVSELEGIRLENIIVPWGHNFDPSGSSLTWHVYHTGVHVPWKFRVSAMFRSTKVSSTYGFAKGSRGGTSHVPRGTWRHMTNAIVVPALWRIFWRLFHPNRPSRSGAINRNAWTDGQTDWLTNRPANYITLTVCTYPENRPKYQTYRPPRLRRGGRYWMVGCLAAHWAVAGQHGIQWWAPRRSYGKAGRDWRIEHETLLWQRDRDTKMQTVLARTFAKIGFPGGSDEH